MQLEKDISSVLQQYVTETGVYSMQKVESDFVEVAKQVDAERVTNGLSDAFRSDQTASFGQLVGHSFEQMDADRRAGMLNQLLNAENDRRVNARDIDPALVEQIAQEAELNDPAVVEKMSNLFAEDLELARTLGGHALSVALVKIAEHR